MQLAKYSNSLYAIYFGQDGARGIKSLHIDFQKFALGVDYYAGVLTISIGFFDLVIRCKRFQVE